MVQQFVEVFALKLKLCFASRAYKIARVKDSWRIKEQLVTISLNYITPFESRDRNVSSARLVRDKAGS